MQAIDALDIVLSLRFAVARAADSDALAWWEDEALTEAGRALARRLFPNAPEIACQRLAMLAARSRHRAALDRPGEVIHLFDLGDSTELGAADRLREAPWISPPKVSTMDGFAVALASLGVTEPPTVRHRGMRGAIEIEAGGRMDVRELAALLASGYLIAEPGVPVFPYVRRSSVQIEQV